MAKSCPVNFQKVNENQIRIQALLITLTALAFIFSGWVLLAFLLLYDFSVRLFISPKLSLFVQIAIIALKIFNISECLVDSAPKIFASQIGLGFSFVIVATSLFGLNDIAMIFAVILALCAAMEAIINYCVGCKCYAVLHHFNII